jgi:thiopurine S-methyltransferase
VDHAFWHERWDGGQINFNQAEVHPLLAAHWSELGCPRGSRVFVPLCGKTIDMAWLVAKGHRVNHSDLSERAVSDFFAEQRLASVARSDGDLVVHTAGDYALWCGDFFQLSAAHLDGVEAVYDRASLIALPPDVRRRYATHLCAILPPAAVIFLIVVEYDQSEMSGPPFSVTVDETAELYGDAFDIDLVTSYQALESNERLRERGLTHLEETLLVLRRSA